MHLPFPQPSACEPQPVRKTTLSVSLSMFRLSGPRGIAEYNDTTARVFGRISGGPSLDLDTGRLDDPLKAQPADDEAPRILGGIGGRHRSRGWLGMLTGGFRPHRSRTKCMRPKPTTLALP